MKKKYVLKPSKNYNFEKLNDFRIWCYKFGSNPSIDALPPTSNSIRLHILRAFYIIYLQTNCLNLTAIRLNPLHFGYEKENELLLPAKVKILVPPINELVPSCTCQKCAKKSCLCILNEIACCKFCKCEKKEICRNSYNST